MMKRTIFATAVMALLISGHASAQNDETEIIVTDNNGNEEEIDLPEAMTYELDSLLNLYNATCRTLILYMTRRPTRNV